MRSKRSMTVHDDSFHSGSAKRDAANGIAALDSSGNLLSAGSKIRLPKDGTNNIYFNERSTFEDMLVVSRIAANDYDLFMKESGVTRQVQTASMKDVASGIMALDANNRASKNRMPALLRSGLIGTVAWGDVGFTSGTWVETASAAQTDFDDLLVSAAGYMLNTSNTNGDQFRIQNLTLNAGTYVITVAYSKDINRGILEILHGASSFGTIDCYAAAPAYNQVATLTLSPAVRNTADLIIEVNGHNGASSGYFLTISRIQIRKTA